MLPRIWLSYRLTVVFVALQLLICLRCFMKKKKEENVKLRPAGVFLLAANGNKKSSTLVSNPGIQPRGEAEPGK